MASNEGAQIFHVPEPPRVATTLTMAVVADIDDLAPGVGEDGTSVTDSPGFAIDSGELYAFDFNTGTGKRLATGGTWGIHTLGGSLFDDGRARVYLLSKDAEVLEMDPTTYAISEVLAVGPEATGGAPEAGWGGMTGPLTQCTAVLRPD